MTILRSRRGGGSLRDHPLAPAPWGLISVPRQPTTAMLAAGYNAVHNFDGDSGYVASIYEAMIAAAPSGNRTQTQTPQPNEGR